MVPAVATVASVVASDPATVVRSPVNAGKLVAGRTPVTLVERSILPDSMRLVTVDVSPVVTTVPVTAGMVSVTAPATDTGATVTAPDVIP